MNVTNFDNKRTDGEGNATRQADLLAFSGRSELARSSRDIQQMSQQESFMTRRFAGCGAKLFVLPIVMLISLYAAGQSVVTGDAVGTVTDPSGAVVSGAVVTLTSSDTAATQSVVTGTNGFYRFTLLKPGQYSLTVKQTGFKS